MKLHGGILRLATACSTLLVIGACGGGSGEETETGGTETVATAGGEGDGGELDLDPCDPSAEPCDGGEVGEGAEGEGAEGEGTEGEGAEGEAAEGEAAEGEAAEGEVDPGDPRAMRRRGRVIFSQACGTCHPSGEEDIGPDIRQKYYNPDAVWRLIRAGRGRMRPITTARLPDESRDALMAYLQSIGSVRRPR